MTQPPPVPSGLPSGGAGWAPPPADPGYPGYPPPPPRQGTNGFAIAALVLGIIGGFVLSVIFGIIALSQIRRSGQSGRGLAIAGLVISGVWTLLVVAVIVAAIATGANRDSTGTITSGGSVSATDLRVGDCVNDLKDSNNLLSLPAVPCANPHEGEVFAVFDLPEGPYPGAASVDDQVNVSCSERLPSYSQGAFEDPAIGLFVSYPLEVNWRLGDREVVCIATSLSGRTTGSLRGR